MKKCTPFGLSLVFIPLFLFCGLSQVPLYPQNTSFVHTSRLKEDLFFLEELQPAEENSENEKKIIDYLENRLNESNIPYEKYGFEEASTYYSYSSNIEINIPSKTVGAPTLVIVCPLNLFNTTERSGPFNIALTLGLIEYFSSEPPAISLRFLFAGAENRTETPLYAGSSLFLSRLSPQNQLAVLYLDFYECPERVDIIPGSAGRVTPFWYLQGILTLLQKQELNYQLDGTLLQVIRINRENRPSPLGAYLNAGYPALLLGSAGSANQDPNGWTTDFIEVLESFFEQHREGLPESPDLHYILLGNSPYSLLLNQRQYLVLLSGFLILMLSTIFIFPVKIRIRIRALWKKSYQIPLLFAGLLILLYTASLTTEGFFSWLAEDWTERFLRSAILFKLTFSLFLYYSLFHIPRRKFFTRSWHFYQYTAVLFSLLTLVFLMGINITYSIYGLWSLLMTILFMFFRRKTIKTGLLILSAAPYAQIAYHLYAKPYWEVTQVLSGTTLTSSLILGIMMFPFILQLSSLHFMPHRYPHRLDHIRTIVIQALLGLSAAGFAVFALIALRPDGPVLYSIREEALQDRGMRLIDIEPVPDQPLTLLTPETQYSILPGSSRAIHSLMTSDLLSIDITREEILSRVQLILTLSPKWPAEEIRISLESEDSIIIYDSFYPVHITSEGHSAVFYTGIRPPEPLSLDFILARDVPLEAVVEIHYAQAPYPYSTPENFPVESKGLVIRDRFKIN